MIRVLAALAALPALGPLTAWAHGFDERYDLPAPLAWFVAGASLSIALTFVFAMFFARSAPVPGEQQAPEKWLRAGPALQVPGVICRAAALLLFLVTIAAALWGTGDPMMNLAPTFVWIIWWVGLSLLVACVGNIWPVLDPWRTLFALMDHATRRLGRPEGLSLGWHWPPGAGVWPAVALLLAWSWLEVVYPVAATPYRLGLTLLAWSAVTLTGMVCFGRKTWQRHVDVFAIYFNTLGRMAPLGAAQRTNGIAIRMPGTALITTGADAPSEPSAPAGSAGFVVAMLSTVLFDGLHGGQAWLLLEQLLKQTMPRMMDINGYFAGTVGLVGVWLLFFAAYQLTCFFTAALTRDASGARIALRFAPTLVPIAVAYNVAHNFSSLMIQGQNAMSLLSDPFGWRWNLFGTAQLHANIGLVDARLTWHVAVGAIVAGHAIAVWLAHRVALRDAASPRQAAIASLPLTVLMIAYTAISLSVIAEPMVTFEPAAPGASIRPMKADIA